MEMNRILAEQAFFAKVSKLRVRNSAAAVAVIHGMAAHTVRFGRFDDDVARKVRHLAPRDAGAEMLIRQRLVEREGRSIDRLDESPLRLNMARPPGRLPVAAAAVLTLF